MVGDALGSRCEVMRGAESSAAQPSLVSVLGPSSTRRSPPRGLAEDTQVGHVAFIWYEEANGPRTTPRHAGFWVGPGWNPGDQPSQQAWVVGHAATPGYLSHGGVAG